MINLIYYRHNLQTPPLPIPPNKISFDELTLVIKGTMHYVIDGAKILLEKGDIIYIPKGSIRHRLLGESADYVSLNFVDNSPLALPLFIKDGLTEIVHYLIRTFDSIIEYTTNLQDERFQLLLSCLIKQLEKQCEFQSELPLVLNIKNYVKVHLSSKITLSDVSKHTHYSIPHCEMVFKQTTGLSIMEYIIKKRISLAKTLLLEGVLSLPEIANTVGFNDYNYFSRVFKKEVGVSPLRYRNNFYF